MRKFVALSVLFLLAAGSVSAQQSAADCADLEDDRERLECFDRFFSGGGGEATSDRRAPAANRSDTRAADRTAAAPSARASASRKPSGPASPEDDFGREKKILELGGDEMTSTALGSFKHWNRGQRIRLENGQVWEITNSTGLYHKATNPRVRIEKGMFSSFYLHVDGVSKSLKVRRIR